MDDLVEQVRALVAGERDFVANAANAAAAIYFAGGIVIDALQQFGR